MDASSLNNIFADCCNSYLKQFCDKYELQYEADAWVADQAGTIAAVGDWFFDFHDVIKFAVDNNLEKLDTILEWYDYCERLTNLNMIAPNFRSWYRGCPRYDDEYLTHLEEMKNELMNAARESEQKMF